MIIIYFAKVFAIPKKLAFGTFEVAIAEKLKLSRRTGYSAKTGLTARYFEYRCVFQAKAKIGKTRGALKPLPGAATKYATTRSKILKSN